MKLQNWIVRSVSLVVFVNGLAALYRPLAEHISERLEPILMPINVENAGRSLDILLGVSLTYLALQLLQRKKAAWWVSVAITLALIGVHIVVSRSIYAQIIPVTGLTALLASRSYFRARSEPTNIRRGLLIFVGSLAFAILYGAFGFWLLHRRDFGVTFSFTEAVWRSLKAYALVGNDDLVARTRYAKWFLDSLAITGWLSVLYGFYSVFRPIAFRLQSLPEERHRVEQLLEQFSTSSDDFFKVWPHDKSYFFWGSQAAIAYSVSSGVALVMGDPAGPDNQIPGAIAAFSAMCQDNGWSQAYIYTSERYLKKYEAAGLDIIKIGEDAVVSLPDFADFASSSKHFRNIRNRFEKAGYVTKMHRPPHGRRLLEQLQAISGSWLSQPGRQEWRFVAGSFNRAYLQQCALFVAYDDAGRPLAFANQIPVYQPGWATIDLMRYGADAPSNIMDFLFMQIMLNLSGEGYEFFNMGLAPLSGLENAAAAEERLMHLVYRSPQPFLSLKGLRQFKAKFSPVWQPKFVAYSGGPARLPVIAIALAKVMRDWPQN